MRKSIQNPSFSEVALCIKEQVLHKKKEKVLSSFFQKKLLLLLFAARRASSSSLSTSRSASAATLGSALPHSSSPAPTATIFFLVSGCNRGPAAASGHETTPEGAPRART